MLELEQWGAVFDRTPEGLIMQRPFGGHTYRRLNHVGDRTGLELIRTVQDQAVAVGMTCYMEVTMTRLLKDGDRVVGAFGYYRETGRFLVIKAKAVVLATGGWGRMYKVTSNSWESTGDGAMLAYDAGAELMDMEMVQFHPTGMVWPPGVRGLLVTEGVRGEGGILRNGKGERFMFNPKYMPAAYKGRYAETEEEAARWLDDKDNNRPPPELLPRDVVARAIYREVLAGNGTRARRRLPGRDAPRRGLHQAQTAQHVRAVPRAGRRGHHHAADGGLPDHPLHDGRRAGRAGDVRDDRAGALRGGRGGGGRAWREPAGRQRAVRHPGLRQARGRGGGRSTRSSVAHGTIDEAQIAGRGRRLCWRRSSRRAPRTPTCSPRSYRRRCRRAR